MPERQTTHLSIACEITSGVVESLYTKSLLIV